MITKVAVAAVRLDSQSAVLAMNLQIATFIKRAISRAVVAHNLAHCSTVGAQGVDTRRTAGRADSRDHIASLRRECVRRNAVGVGMSRWYVVYNLNSNCSRTRNGFSISGSESKNIGLRYVRYISSYRFQLIGVVGDASPAVVCGDGQGTDSRVDDVVVPQIGNSNMGTIDRNTLDVGQTIRIGDSEGTMGKLGDCSSIGANGKTGFINNIKSTLITGVGVDVDLGRVIWGFRRHCCFLRNRHSARRIKKTTGYARGFRAGSGSYRHIGGFKHHVRTAAAPASPGNATCSARSGSRSR